VLNDSGAFLRMYGAVCLGNNLVDSPSGFLAAEKNKNQKVKKPPEYPRFEKLLKQVVKAPPMRKGKEPTDR
jgi:hypothetical protein